MNANEVRACVAAWLRYKRQYPLVCFERPLDGDYNGKPDILAVDKQRYAVEVEVKISAADVRQEFKKRKYDRNYRLSSNPWDHRVRQKYFAIPEDLRPKVEDLIPKHYGILTVRGWHPLGSPVVFASRRAKIHQAQRLTIKDVITMVRHQSGTLVSLALKSANSSPGTD